jgi:Iodothyronine deiodinase
LGELEELYDRHGDEVAFFVVYIREAHPEDGWVLTVNRREGIALTDPTTLAERAAAAVACALLIRTRLPILLDDLDDAAARAYGGWPDRLTLVGADGRVAYLSEPGPEGFRPAELGAAIERELSQTGPSVRRVDGDSPRSRG